MLLLFGVCCGALSVSYQLFVRYRFALSRVCCLLFLSFEVRGLFLVVCCLFLVGWCVCRVCLLVTSSWFCVVCSLSCVGSCSLVSDCCL